MHLDLKEMVQDKVVAGEKAPYRGLVSVVKNGSG